MANKVDDSKILSQTRFMSGRRVIKTSVPEINDANVMDVLDKAMAVHDVNSSEIDYLCREDDRG